MGCCVALVLPSRMRISVTATMPIISKLNANREVVIGLMILMLLRQTPVKQTVRFALNYVNLLTVFTMN